MKLTLIDLIEEGKEYTLPNKAETTLGRNPENDIQITAKGISKIHCKIYKISNKFGIMDLGSKNGTYIGNKKLSENKKYLLKNNSKLKLSGYRLKIKISGETSEDPESIEDIRKGLSKELDEIDNTEK